MSIRVDENGLINPLGQDHQENCLLFTLEYLYLMDMIDMTDVTLMNAELIGIRLANKGDHFEAYKNAVEYLAPGDVYASHDNLTAIASASYSYEHGQIQCKKVWEQLKADNFKHRALSDKGELEFFFTHPRDIIYWGILNNNLICKLLFPLLIPIAVLSALSDSMSGKLLWWVRCNTLIHKTSFKYLYKLITFIIKHKVGSWYKVFRNYHKDGHDITILAEKVYGSE